MLDMEAEDFDDWGDDENQDIMNMVNTWRFTIKCLDFFSNLCESVSLGGV